MEKNKKRTFPMSRLRNVMSFLLVFLISQSSWAQSSVTGQVKDKDGNPVKAATVAIKNKTTSTSSGDDGQFIISASPGDVLVISSIGYESNEVKVSDKKNIVVTMVTKMESLDDLVVVGYGSQKKKDLTGSISVVNVTNAKKTASYDMAKMLQGQVPGVSVHGSGEPGGFVQIKIRGISTFGNNSPLFVIDGVPITAPYDFSPDDIESMQVLKDASAGAIYGARASTGVIIITTKKGKAGKLKIDYNGYIGVQNVPKKIDVTNAEGYRKITNQAELNAGLLIAPGNDPASPQFIKDVDTDWQEEG